jgi:nucleotide-binding universal stress UspA family protein
MYKTILTYLPAAKSAPLLCEVASYLAEKCRAHLIGAHNSARITLYGGIPSDFLAQHNQAQREEAEAIQQAFEKVAGSRNLSHAWRHKALRDTDAFDDIISAGRTADLIIAGGRGEDDPLGQWYDLPVRLILETGRPVLMIPQKGKFDTIGERITVGWNHSRESARAAFDALPLLKMANSVRVLAVNSTENGIENPSQDLAAALARHGVNAEAAVANATGQSDADELAANLLHTKSDLLVIGCYGHSRIREMVLGGVTLHILRTMTIPVLMSH